MVTPETNIEKHITFFLKMLLINQNYNYTNDELKKELLTINNAIINHNVENTISTPDFIAKASSSHIVMIRKSPTLADENGYVGIYYAFGKDFYVFSNITPPYTFNECQQTLAINKNYKQGIFLDKFEGSTETISFFSVLPFSKLDQKQNFVDIETKNIDSRFYKLKNGHYKTTLRKCQYSKAVFDDELNLVSLQLHKHYARMLENYFTKSELSFYSQVFSHDVLPDKSIIESFEKKIRLAQDFDYLNNDKSNIKFKSIYDILSELKSVKNQFEPLTNFDNNICSILKKTENKNLHFDNDSIFSLNFEQLYESIKKEYFSPTPQPAVKNSL